jgi:uncharacterized Tic20 family protein
VHGQGEGQGEGQGDGRGEQDREDPPPPASGQIHRPGAPLSRKEVHRWAAGAHLGGVLAWIPVAPIIPAAAIYAVYKDRSPYLKEQALEAINFQICVFLLWILASLIDKLPIIYGFTFLVWLFSAFFAMAGAVAALRGYHFRYPLSHRFLHQGNSRRWGGGPRSL